MNGETTSMDTLGLMVCECSRKDGEIIKIRVFMTKEESLKAIEKNINITNAR